jgi:hypothetical protein
MDGTRRLWPCKLLQPAHVAAHGITDRAQPIDGAGIRGDFLKAFAFAIALTSAADIRTAASFTPQLGPAGISPCATTV